jgi:hypothetical protein
LVTTPQTRWKFIKKSSESNEFTLKFRDLAFPSNRGDDTVVQFIESLLKKKVNERLCNLEGIKMLDFYNNFKWNELVDFSLAPPFKPEEIVTTNFFQSKIKYLEKLQKKSIMKKESILSSYEDDGKEVYDPNWANIF